MSLDTVSILDLFREKKPVSITRDIELYKITREEALAILEFFKKRLEEEKVLELLSYVHCSVVDCGIVLKFDYDNV